VDGFVRGRLSNVAAVALMAIRPLIAASDNGTLQTPMRRWASGMLLVGITVTAACGSYPDDVESTLSSIQSAHVIHVGLIAGTDRSPNFAKAQIYLRQVSKDVGATVELREGSTEALLAEVEQGSLDLVIGEIAVDSPWLPDIAVVEPIAERRVGKRSLGLGAIARNGENRWIMLLERHARDVKTSS
jgi:hypothetical protein